MAKAEEHKCTLCGKHKSIYGLSIKYEGNELFWVGCCEECKQEDRGFTVDYFLPKGWEKTKETRRQLYIYLRDKCDSRNKYINREELLRIRDHLQEHPLDVILQTKSACELIREIRDDSYDAHVRRTERQRRRHR